MKKLSLILILAITLASCSKKTYDYEFEVDYTNGDTEKISMTIEDSDNNPTVKLKTKFRSVSELVIIGSGNLHYFVAADVRNYEFTCTKR